MVGCRTAILVVTFALVPAAQTRAQCPGQWNTGPGTVGASGTSGAVLCAAVLTTGDLVVGGSFQSAGSVAAVDLARWNGSSWNAVGTADAAVSTLLAGAAGAFIAGGAFTTVQGAAANHISMWNGSAWSA